MNSLPRALSGYVELFFCQFNGYDEFIMKNMDEQNSWRKDGWRDYEARHQPSYEDEKVLASVVRGLEEALPLVSYREIEALREDLALVARGEAMLLQGGDCAETFADAREDVVRHNFKAFMQMTIALMAGMLKPVVKVGRVAGQYVKPRSSPTEKRDGITLPSYLGDMVNGIEFDAEARRHDPHRMRQGYEHAAATLNMMRSMAARGSASLETVHGWMLQFIKESPVGQRFAKTADKISESIAFMKACGVPMARVREFNEVRFYSSHEALLLPYEEAMTRPLHSGGFYNSSAHMVWIGERTRQVDGAHVMFARGIVNPLGVKVSDQMTEDELIRLVDILNPHNQEGRLTLICRMGHEKVAKSLPSLVRCLKKEGRSVIWMCDPMHGNTIKSQSGYKTRPFDYILAELSAFTDIVAAEGIPLGGIHVEMTGEDVTECIGGGQGIADDTLANRYETYCDPRLNAHQALELAFLIVDKIGASHSPS